VSREFYIAGGFVAILAQVAVSPNSTVPNLGASGAIAAVMGAFLVTYPRDQIRALLIIFIFVRVTVIPAALLNWGCGSSSSCSMWGRWQQCSQEEWLTSVTSPAPFSVLLQRVFSKTHGE